MEKINAAHSLLQQGKSYKRQKKASFIQSRLQNLKDMPHGNKRKANNKQNYKVTGG